MILGTGIDIVSIARFQKAMERPGFIQRLFTPQEIEYCEARANKAQSYAVRFAAKEAAMKALGTGWAEGLAWKDISVQNDANGMPVLILDGAALEMAKMMGANAWHVSMSHERENGIAMVLLEA